MTDSRWAQASLDIGVLEFRRSIRALWRSKGRFALIALGAAVPTLIGALVVFVFADAIRGLETLSELDSVRGMVALFWLFAVFLIGQRVVSVRTRIEAEPFVLTTVSSRATAGGLVVAETLRVLAYFAPPVLLTTAVCVLLLGSPASLLVVPTTAALFAATAVVTGSAAGYVVALLVATSPFVARHKTVLGTAASLLGFGGYALFFYPQIGGVDQSSLAVLPVGWFADLALAGTGLTTTPLRWFGVGLSSAVILLVGGFLVDRLTTTLWFIEPVSVDSDGSSDGERAGELTLRRDALTTAAAPLPVPRLLSTPTRRVAEWALLRTRRDSNRLMFLMIPLFAVGSAVVNTAIQSGSIETVAAPLCAVALPWVVGSLFAMNPFGDEGAVLPVTLTAVPGRQYVRGLLVPGLLIGLPLVPLVTGLATLVSPYTLLERVGLITLSGFVTCVAVAIAPAIGMVFPRFSAISVGRSCDVIPPRMTAVALHAGLTVVPGTVLAGLVLAPELTRGALAGLFGVLPAVLSELLAAATADVVAAPADWFVALGDGIGSLDLAVLRFGGGGLVLVGGLLVAVLSYRRAIDRFEHYTTA
ncbi:hypothetical protein Htur_3363 [Haloterrigena turkmenica DSM 5511]|uniref:ABC-2 type transport system permease protein n=1 Tax=Haloterrigena turkmenica (strain ATCC 51198 / DSM 5511 / JCM 9101 / NCIMB 13204 / VKM B-1734 / 4k) TaxID=543526 RepID=D2RPS5_HALTV|nr:hypothetical protein [Haloterrigena turkmenica]ADB62227.1 hypothetical protein Htur_3363 [Haloterrigena turkmenica DSM 5511]